MELNFLIDYIVDFSTTLQTPKKRGRKPVSSYNISDKDDNFHLIQPQKKVKR